MSFDHLAALVRAVARLRQPGPLDPALLDALATLMLPRPEVPRASGPPSMSAESATTFHRAETAALQPEPAPGHKPPGTAQGDLDDAQGRRQRRMQHDRQKLVGLPSSWVQLSERADLAAPRTSTPAPSPAQAPGDAHLTPAPLESLFPANRVRAILRGMATSSTPSGKADIAAAVALIARAEPIQRLPQRYRTTLGHTIVLLFDAGPAMLPFARDKQQLAATALRLLGKDRVRIADFIGDPLRGVRPQRQVRWEALRWPSRGSTLLLVSDLGIGGAAAELGLGDQPAQAFLDECQRRGLRTVALLPYQRDRWPVLAARFDVAITWDLDIGVQALRRSTRQRR